MYIDDNAATDAISTRLREVCPSLYSSEDAVCSKVGHSDSLQSVPINHMIQIQVFKDTV